MGQSGSGIWVELFVLAGRLLGKKNSIVWLLMVISPVAMRRGFMIFPISIVVPAYPLIM